MAQPVGKSPENLVDFAIPPTFEVLGFDKKTNAPICMRPAGDRPPTKEPILDEDGNPVYRYDEVSGKRLGQRYRLVEAPPLKVIARRDPRGHLRWDPFIEESAEEKAARLRAAKIEDAQKDLAAALVDSGMSPADLIARLTGVAASADAQLGASDDDDELEEDAGGFPMALGGGHYELSNGTKMRGKEAAYAAQDMIDNGEDTG